MIFFVISGFLIARRAQLRWGELRDLSLCGFYWLSIYAVIFAGRSLWPIVHEGYGLWLNLSAACSVLGAHWLELAGGRVRGIGWLCSCGRLSYEIYLFHVFCVFGVIGIARASGLAPAYGFVWYVPAIMLSWLLGYLVATLYPLPCERWLRRRMSAHPVAATFPAT